MEELFSFRTDRLTSRLQAMLACWRYARKVGAKTTCVWPKPRDEYIESDTQHYEISRIIDLPRLAMRAPDLRLVDGPVPRKMLNLWKKNGHRVNASPVIEDPEIFAMGDMHLNGALQAFRLPSETAEDVQKEISELFRQLPVRRHLSVLVEEEKADDLVAVHVRRGDLVPYGRAILVALQRGNHDQMKAKFRMLMAKTVPIGAYSEYLEKSGANALFFSDNDDVAQALCDRSGTQSSRVYRCSDETLYPIERDFVTMLVMGQCREIVGGGSVYARFAAKTTGTPLRDLRALVTWQDYVDMIWDECLDPIKDEEFVTNRARYSKMLSDAITSDDQFFKVVKRITNKARNHAPPGM